MPTSPSLTHQLQLLRCQVASSAYAFDARHIHAIHRWESVEPASPASGAIGTLHGKPVYRLAQLLGLDDHAAPATAASTPGPVLLLDSCALQVDNVSRPLPVAESGLRRLPLPAQSVQRHIRGLARIEGELTLLLDPQQIHPARSGPAAPPPWPSDQPWHAATSGATEKLLCFTPTAHDLSTYLAVSYRQAVEVALGLKLTRLRCGQPWLAGLTDWRQRAVPVVDFAGLLGYPSTTPTDTSRLLIVRSSRRGELFAFPATQVAPLPLPLSDDTTLVKTLDPPSPYIRAAYELVDGYLFLPDLDKLASAH